MRSCSLLHLQAEVSGGDSAGSDLPPIHRELSGYRHYDLLLAGLRQLGLHKPVAPFLDACVSRIPSYQKPDAFDEVVIQENESGDFVITIHLLTSEDLATWSALDLSEAVVNGDQITLVVPASESVEFLRLSGGN